MIVIYRGLSIIFVMISNNFFIPILALAIFSSAGLITSQDAFGHVDPNGCTGNNASGGVTLFRGATAFGGGVIQGETITAKMEVFTGGTAPCAFAGGGTQDIGKPLEIQNPGGAFQDVDASYPCVGGDDDGGDQIGDVDCGDDLASHFSSGQDYVVDCNDVETGGTFVGKLLWLVRADGLLHDDPNDSPASNTFASSQTNRDCEIKEYTVVTTSSDSGVQDGTVTDPEDTVTITGFEGVEGRWVTDAVLDVPIGADLEATCTVSPEITDTFDLIVTCTLDDAPIGLTDPGPYCWNVDVEETTDVYGDIGDQIYLGAADLTGNECFTIPETYMVITSSSTTGTQEAPVSDPTDTVTITGTEGTEGRWVTSAVLVLPDTSELPATCDPSPETTDTFDLIVLCELNDSIDLEDPGPYCWDVTVTETTDAYISESDGTFIGADDPDNECFTVPEEYFVVTTSSDTDVQEAPVSDPTDTVTITGVEGTEGRWVTSAVLVLPDTSELPATCDPSPETTDTFDLIVLCELNDSIDLEDPGPYCWDVTVTEITDAYGIASDGTFFGIADEENECFEIGAGAGCTPGFWKGNARDKGANPTDACQWSEPTDTPLNSIFHVSKNDLDKKDGTDTLLDALNFHGGNCAKDGTERQLLRMAVAAKLNIEADIGYAIADLGALQALVNDSHDTVGQDARCAAMKTVHGQLGEFNEGPGDFEEEFGFSFCPLSNSVDACPTD